MRTAIYARCSTDLQDPTLQTSELTEYARPRGFALVGTFVDIASGSRDDRPELQKILTLAKQRKIDAVLVWKLDRLGRSLKHLVNVIDELESVGVKFISLRDNLDFTTPAGRLLFGVIASMAQFERDLIRERVTAGMANAKRKGVRLGRKPVAFDIAELRRLRAAGLSFETISRQTGVSVGTTYRALSAAGKI
jgi:putative DNA-invertase from lambdoid prophage Rac